MAHATPWNAQATGEAPLPRGSAVGVRPVPLDCRPSSRRRHEFRLSLGTGVSTVGPSGTRAQTDSGTSPSIGPFAETSTGEAVDPWRAARGVSDRSLDPTARDRIDSPGVRRALSPSPRLEDPDKPRLELSEAGTSGHRAGRSSDRAVEAARLAPDKKTPRAAALISSSSMRVASCSCQTSSAHGPRRDRRPACATATGTIASRFAVASPCRLRGEGSRCIYDVGHEISVAWTSARSSSTC